MKRLIIALMVPLLVFACSNKKKGMLLIPPSLLGSNDTQGTTPAAATTTAANESFTVVSLDTTDTSQISTTSTPSASTTSETTTSTDSPVAETTTIPEVITPSSAATVPVAAPTIVTTNTTTTIVNQTTATGGFNFETNVTVPVTVHLVNAAGAIANAPVTISESQSTSGESNVLGQGTTDATGTAVIIISVPPTVTQVNISVVGVNPTNGEVQEVTGFVPVQVSANMNGTTTSTGTVIVAPTVNLNASNFQPANGCIASIDSDCDGVANINDEFPTDSALASTARSGRYTIAFEDLFPNAGDADLNDHTTVFSTEMDKTPTNKVKILRGIFTHVGKGAGYNHELRLKLDVPVGAKFEISYVDGAGNPWTGCAAATKYVAGASGDCNGGNMTVAALKTGLLILPSSDKTLFGKQNSPAPGATFSAKDFVRGVTANVTITFDEAVDLGTNKNTVGGHLNWFLAFNQKTNGVYRQIFRPGYVIDATGKDTYIDSKGFPWAIIVPGVFNHPTGGSDIRKPSSSGYAYFNTWAESKGTEHKDWYTQITNPVYVVRIKDFYTENGFSAYLIKAVRTNIFEVSVSLIMLGAAMGFLLKKRIEKKSA